MAERVDVVIGIDNQSFNAYAQNMIRGFEILGHGIEAFGGAIDATYGLAIQAATQLIQLVNTAAAVRTAVAASTLDPSLIFTLGAQIASVALLTATIFQLRAGKAQSAAQFRQFAAMTQIAGYFNIAIFIIALLQLPLDVTLLLIATVILFRP